MNATAFGRVSIIIANYNYGQFLPAAVDSALSLDWPDVEVIVIDDGSTDNSREVIAGYGSRIISLLQENSSQRVARNRGFELSSGDVIIHLDSDDVLRPGIARAVADVWGPKVSKVQVQMERIDAADRLSGGVFPRFRRTPSPSDIRRWATETGAYPTPPGSGNVYARWFLEKLFPLDSSCGPATDSACLAAAPHLGDVITIPRPLVGYRVHGGNASTLTKSPESYGAAVERALQRHAFGRRIAGLTPSDERSLRKSRHLLQLRVASRRLSPSTHPISGDTIRRLVVDSLRSPFYPGPESPIARLAILSWSIFVSLAPEPFAAYLIRARFKLGPGGRDTLSVRVRKLSRAGR